MKKTNTELYLDYVSNFLTVQRFADANGLSRDDAARAINAGRKEHEANAARHKTPTRAQLERWIASKGYPTFIIDEMLSA